MNIKNGFKKIRNCFNNILEYTTLKQEIKILKQEIKILKKELEESKNKEKPYINKINSLKSQLRVCKIINTRLERKVDGLNEEISKYEQKEKTSFENLGN